MAIEKMSVVSVAGVLDDLDGVLLKCCESKCFQMEAGLTNKYWNDSAFNNLHEINPYTSLLKRAYSIAIGLGLKPEFTDYSDFEPDTPEELEVYLSDVEKDFSSLCKQKNGLEQSISQHTETLRQVERLVGMNADFEELFACKYVKVRFGRLPSENEHKLEYYSEKCFFFIPFGKDGEYEWCLYLTPTAQAEYIDGVFNSLYFERTHFPDYLKGNADESIKSLTKMIESETALLAVIKADIDSIKSTEREKIMKLYSKLKYKNDCFELRKKVAVMNGKFYIYGYVTKKKCGEFCKEIESNGRVSAVEMPVENDPNMSVPVKLKNNPVFKPFEMFVRMYGLPNYDGIDPTPYVAVTYMLIYGIMFGDLGQGLCISLLGLLITKWKHAALGPIMTRIGLCSAAFGVLYGSVFGIETIITPFFHHETVWKMLGYTSQPENIFQISTILLIAALAIGVILILISMVMNIVLCFRKKKFGDAVYGVNGIAGFVFYCSVVVGAACQLGLGIELFSAPYVICLIVLPLCVIFFKHPLENATFGRNKTHEKKTVGNFIIESIIEIFESCLSYLSNTMSFLRIGGFILSHAGMMLVVAQLAGTRVENPEITVATVIISILGNAFVMGMEGFLVGIQVLRLEFYEIFSRFYDGNGQEFIPLEIKAEVEG